MTSFFLNITAILLVGISPVLAQSKSDLQSRISLCREENRQLESSVKNYQEVMKKQHGEIIEAKKEIIKLKSDITDLNTKNDKLRLEIQNRNVPAQRMMKLAKRFYDRKRKQEAIELYNAIILSYPSSHEASEARKTLRELSSK